MNRHTHIYQYHTCSCLKNVSNHHAGGKTQSEAQYYQHVNIKHNSPLPANTAV